MELRFMHIPLAAFLVASSKPACLPPRSWAKQSINGQHWGILGAILGFWMMVVLSGKNDVDGLVSLWLDAWPTKVTVVMRNDVMQDDLVDQHAYLTAHKPIILIYYDWYIWYRFCIEVACLTACNSLGHAFYNGGWSRVYRTWLSPGIGWREDLQ